MREWLAGSGPPREMPRRYTYAPAPSAPWSNGVGRAISVGLGSDLLGNTARALLLSCRQASTYNTYRSVLNSWAQFLASEGVEDIMLATTTTVLRYVAWLGLRGAVPIILSTIPLLFLGNPDVAPRAQRLFDLVL